MGERRWVHGTAFVLSRVVNRTDHGQVGHKIGKDAACSQPLLCWEPGVRHLPICLALVFVLGSASVSPAEESQAANVRRSGTWFIEETQNFSICWPAGYRVQGDLAATFEQMREKLCATWLPKHEVSAWQPKCHIVIHARFEGYAKEVGPGARQTTGSSLLDFDQGRITLRRIDIRGDRADWLSEAFAHELTHVVLAERFIDTPIPHWADEGMAIQADPVAKRQLHGRDLHSAIAAGGEFRLAELLTLDRYPHPSRMGTFYGQSASIVEFLTQIGTREQLVAFVEQATAAGYDKALRDVYAIAGVGSFEQKWRQHLRTGQGRTTISKRETAAQPDSQSLATADPAVATSDVYKPPSRRGAVLFVAPKNTGPGVGRLARDFL